LQLAKGVRGQLSLFCLCRDAAGLWLGFYLERAPLYTRFHGRADLEYPTNRQVFLARVTLKGIEVVTFRDGIAAALVVIGVLVMRWAWIQVKSLLVKFVGSRNEDQYKQ
jgi:hypothetical protein